jgi:hypothetical protein
LIFYSALLDIAHELTHFAYRKDFNPYKEKFSLSRFIKSTVEGVGGEVEAYLIECRVMRELFPKRAKKNENCNKVFDKKSNSYSKKLGIMYFYRVGSFIDEFYRNRLVGENSLLKFPYLSSQDPLFISSAYGLPYPIASIREYQGIMRKVCTNDKRRIEILKKKLINSEEDGSSHKMNDHVVLEKLNISFQERCRKQNPLF